MTTYKIASVAVCYMLQLYQTRPLLKLNFEFACTFSCLNAR